MPRAPRSSTATPPAVQEAAKRATIPSRPVIQHTSLFRATLQQLRSKATDALASADMALTAAASERDHEMDAAKRAYDAACSVAASRFEAIRSELDAERADCICELDGIDAAMSVTAPAAANVVQISQAAE